MTHVIDNPCDGKDCRFCETCIYDEPIPTVHESKKDEKPTTQDSLCNYCGYLIKTCRGHGDTRFNACCGKSLIEIGNSTRPRNISFGLQDPVDIPVPDWCPKMVKTSPPPVSRIMNRISQPSQDDIYQKYFEKKKKMEKFPKHIEWEDIKEGKIYVVPTLMKQKRKVIRALDKTTYTLRCCILDENGEDTKYIHNVYRQDLDAIFIVEYHKY